MIKNMIKIDNLRKHPFSLFIEAIYGAMIHVEKRKKNPQKSVLIYMKIVFHLLDAHIIILH